MLDTTYKLLEIWHDTRDVPDLKHIHEWAMACLKRLELPPVNEMVFHSGVGHKVPSEEPSRIRRPM